MEIRNMRPLFRNAKELISIFFYWKEPEFEFKRKYTFYLFHQDFFFRLISTAMLEIFLKDCCFKVSLEFETKLSKLKFLPRIWIRYVDDIFCLMKTITIERLLVIMNRRTPQYHKIYIWNWATERVVLFGCWNKTERHQPWFQRVPKTNGNWEIYHDWFTLLYSTQICSF
jgi:hypothetical protein